VRIPRRLLLLAVALVVVASPSLREAFGATGKSRRVRNGKAGRVSAALPARGAAVGDFLASAVYEDGAGQWVGTRWVHKVHGMPVTVLHIQSVPQVFLAFNTPPVSDRGEPHTGEHLLLGKGRKGKALSLEQDLSLVESTAWTSQTDVCYSWSCAAGKETFYRSVEQYLDALLLPDYSDEEIRREVCHIGPVRDQSTGALSVDEQGTIYQEMVATFEKRWNVWDALQKRVWGADHPLALNAGGLPSEVRVCQPHHVREFHAAHYHLAADTEMIVALPDRVPEAEFLTRLSTQMAAVDRTPELASRPKMVHPIPPARPQADKSFLRVPYPNANEDDVGLGLVMWAPTPLGSQEERIIAETLLGTLAAGETSTLHKRLMDRATREVAVDATEVAGGVLASKIDLVPSVWFDGLSPRSATPERMAEIVAVIRDEIRRVAALATGSPALAELNEKALVKLMEREKYVKKQLNSPPLFGHRGAGGFWIDHLRLVDQESAFVRSVTLTPVFAKLRAEIAAGRNPWTAVVQRLGLEQEPYVGASVPSRAELARRRTEHDERIAGYLADITKRYGGDAQTALATFESEYNAQTAEIEVVERGLPKPHLVPDVPLSLDPSLRLEPVSAAGVKGQRGVFDNMSFVEASLSFPLAAREEQLPWLAILPSLITDSGVVIDGKPVPYDEASARRSREIYGLGVQYDLRPSRNRRELRLTASGVDLGEARRALDWLALCAKHAWLEPANLPRLRDLVAQEIQGVRSLLGGSEEDWVRNPAAAVRWQADPIFLATSSIHARLFLLARCEWLLMGSPEGADAEAARTGLTEIEASAGADLPATAAHLDELIARWAATPDASAEKWLLPIARRMKEMVGEMAPSTAAVDLRALVATCRHDIERPAAEALADVRRLVQETFGSRRARFVLTGSRTQTDAILPRLSGLFEELAAPSAPPMIAPPPSPVRRLVEERLRDHESASMTPVHYGLVHNTGATGVFVLAARAGGYADLDPATLDVELASRVFSGAGAHAFFMKTWGAGLAYSNGLRSDASEDRVQYYAERCPDLVQTMRFVTDLVKKAEALDDPYLVEYAVANGVAYTRDSDEYEQRTRAAADDLVDGDTPERLATYRRALLAAKDKPGEWPAMKARIREGVARVLPGLGRRTRDAVEPVFLTIAPSAMLDQWERWLREQDAPDETVFRIYGRDFWMVPRGR
jgi:hypothetical protein